MAIILLSPLALPREETLPKSTQATTTSHGTENFCGIRPLQPACFTRSPGVAECLSPSATVEPFWLAATGKTGKCRMCHAGRSSVTFYGPDGSSSWLVELERSSRDRDRRRRTCLKSILIPDSRPFAMGKISVRSGDRLPGFSTNPAHLPSAIVPSLPMERASPMSETNSDYGVPTLSPNFPSRRLRYGKSHCG